jgi:lysophospholipase L1-like esterase
MQKYLIILTLLLCSLLLQSQKNNTSNTELNKLYPSGEVVSKYHNDWTRSHYKKRIRAFKNNPLSKHEIVFIGNSITEQGEDWSEKFGIQHIRNRGIAGDVTDGVLKRLNEVTHFQPKAVFILIGINDLFNLHHDETGRSNLKYFKIVPSARYVAKNIQTIASKIRKKSPQTVVFVRTILPTRRQYLKEDVRMVNDLLRGYEKKGDYTLIDLYSEFVDEEGLMKKTLTRDGVHFNEKGYEHWVEFEKPIIREVMTGSRLFSISNYFGDKQAAISYTFDDGLQEYYTLVYPKFEELGFKATFWVNGNTINLGEEGLQTKKPRTTWAQLKEMAEEGHEIFNH